MPPQFNYIKDLKPGHYYLERFNKGNLIWDFMDTNLEPDELEDWCENSEGVFHWLLRLKRPDKPALYYDYQLNRQDGEDLLYLPIALCKHVPWNYVYAEPDGNWLNRWGFYPKKPTEGKPDHHWVDITEVPLIVFLNYLNVRNCSEKGN